MQSYALGIGDLVDWSLFCYARERNTCGDSTHGSGELVSLTKVTWQKATIFNPRGCHARSLLSSGLIFFSQVLTNFMFQRHKLFKSSEVLMFGVSAFAELKGAM